MNNAPCSVANLFAIEIATLVSRGDSQEVSVALISHSMCNFSLNGTVNMAAAEMNHCAFRSCSSERLLLQKDDAEAKMHHDGRSVERPVGYSNTHTVTTNERICFTLYISAIDVRR